MKSVLRDAVKVGNATARAISFSPRDEKAYIYEGKQWIIGFIGKDYRWLDLDGHRGQNIDARTMFFYLATVNTPAMALEIPGVGSNYGFSAKDNKGELLYDEKNYKLHIEANVPAKISGLLLFTIHKLVLCYKQIKISLTRVVGKILLFITKMVLAICILAQRFLKEKKQTGYKRFQIKRGLFYSVLMDR